MPTISLILFFFNYKISSLYSFYCIENNYWRNLKNILNEFIRLFLWDERSLFMIEMWNLWSFYFCFMITDLMYFRNGSLVLSTSKENWMRILYRFLGKFLMVLNVKTVLWRLICRLVNFFWIVKLIFLFFFFFAGKDKFLLKIKRNSNWGKFLRVSFRWYHLVFLVLEKLDSENSLGTLIKSPSNGNLKTLPSLDWNTKYFHKPHSSQDYLDFNAKR